MADLKSVVVIERFVQTPETPGTYDFDGHLDAQVEVRCRYATVAGKSSPEGSYLNVIVGNEMLAIPLACVRAALGLAPAPGRTMEAPNVTQ